MNKLDRIRLFVRVAQASSFSKAAENASVTTAKVSRAVSEIESELNTRLLHRTTRRVSLTDKGHRYFEQCMQILTCIDEAEAEAAKALGEPWGRLRVHATMSIGQHYLAPLIAEYHAQFPDVATEIVISQRTPNIVDENFDISVAVSRQLVDSTLVAIGIGTTNLVLCASPGYLERRGIPIAIQDLRLHKCLQLTLPDLPTGHWPLKGPEGTLLHHSRTTPLSVNDAVTLEGAIAAGMGIGPLPVAVALSGLRAGKLRQVLPEYQIIGNDIYAIYASRQYVNAKIRTFVDFLKRAIPLALKDHELELRQLTSSQQ